MSVSYASNAGQTSVSAGSTLSGDVVTGVAAVPRPLALFAGLSGAPVNAFSDYLEGSDPTNWLDVYGAVVSTTIDGGVVFIEAGGTAHSSIIAGGLEFVASGGADTDSTIRSGVEVVDKGGVATGDAVAGVAALPRPLALLAGRSGAPINALYDYLGNRPASALDVYGAVNSATMTGGVAAIESGGAAHGSIVMGGLEFIASGATDSYTRIRSGVEVVDKGGVATGDVVKGAAAVPHPLALVSGAGSALSNYLGRQPASLLDAYGAINRTTIAGGAAIIESGGAAEGSLVTGGLEFVASGGADTNSKITSGVEVVDKGGLASGDLVEGAGAAYANTQSVAYLDVYGQSSHEHIWRGEALIEAGGVADSYVIRAGFVEIFSGGIETGVTSVIDGVLKLDDGSNVQGSIALGPQGLLELDPVVRGLNVSLARNSQSAIELLNVPAGLVSLSFADGVLTAAIKGTTSTFNLANAANLDYSVAAASQGAVITLTNH